MQDGRGMLQRFTIKGSQDSQSHTTNALEGTSCDHHPDIARASTDATTEGKDGGRKNEGITAAEDIGQLAVQGLEGSPVRHFT